MAEGHEPNIRNREAFFQYEILETFECGVVLTGTEVKSIREGKISLKDAYALVRDGEVWLVNCHISPYTHGNRLNHEPRRTRKLLLNKAEIEKLSGRTVEKGLTLIPTRMYFKKGRVKVEIGIARGKKLYDKRETALRKTVDRETRAALKERGRDST
ncbi:MAG TPA: SsrA-binding protein SmpB [Blastocatellia bacterium]|nr:SsrA-binding protein SmpB [Blastocatellia bacterium]